ncbi:restriction endonuclease subunit S, partial [uncultured Phocaeicola sp.]
MYDVPHLRFPEFSGEWEKYRLCDVASIVGRIGFRGYTTNDIVTKGKGAIALSPTNIENNKLTYDKDNTYISFYKYEESPEIMIKQGDVIFVKTGSTVGKVAYVDKLICKTTLNPQVVVLKDIQCDNYLLSVLMSTNKFQNAIRKIIVGGAVPTLSQAAMGDIVVTMPQATEQEKLSKFISLLDDRIATQNKIIEKLQSLIKGIVDELMTVLLKGELYPFASLYIKAGEGGTPTTSVSKYYSGGSIPFIKIDDLSQKYLTSNKDFITELGMQKSSAWLIPSQSVIYSNGATIGAISINK